MPENVLITGANRGIGLGLASSYLDDGHRVFATCRAPERATDLARLAERSKGRLTVHPLDVTSDGQRAALAAALDGEPVDVLLNNAGVYPQKHGGFGRVEAEPWLHGLAVNAVAPVLLAQALVDNVARSRRRVIATVTSRMGSIADNTSGGAYAYRSSKTALNSAMRSAAIDLRDRGITVVVLHPGWVRTDMGGSGAQITVDRSVADLRRVLDGLTLEDTGRFLNRDGTDLPW